MAPRDHPGGPWQQQDGHEVVNDTILVDFGVTSGPDYVSFLGVQNAFNLVLFLGLCPGPSFIDFCLAFSTFWTSKSVLLHGRYYKS